MGMTITEKILARHAGMDELKPGQIIEVNVDLMMMNDITGPLAIEALKKVGHRGVFDKDKLVLVLDHYVPNKDLAAAEASAMVTQYAREESIKHFYGVGPAGVEHVLLPDEGFVMPGDLIIGADSHTCTYGALGAFSTGVGSTDAAAIIMTGKTWLRVPETIKVVYRGRPGRWVSGKDLILRTIGEIGVDGALYCALEFTGEAVVRLDQASRFTMANMAIEAGGKNGIFIPDDVTKAFVTEHPSIYGKEPIYYDSDPDADYKQVVEINIDGMEPQVAAPHLPSNVKPVTEFRDVKIDQAFVGSCTNGRIEDLRTAAEIIKGKKINKDVRMVVIPATPAIYRQAMKEGLLEIFLDAGAVIGPPTCGPCLGGHMGVLAAGERCVSTSNRNFIGRMGHKDSEVYLANPAVAAASAVAGRIASPEEVV